MARDPISDFSGDRRDFFRLTAGKVLRQVERATEERLVARRYVRPPGAMPEIAFLAACTRCGACGPVCPAGAIEFATTQHGLAAGTPYLEPTRVPCIACPEMPCAVACPTEALLVPEDGWRSTKLGRITFHPERCITFEGNECGVCARSCPVGETALALDDLGRPILKLEGCVGCGVCVRECPTNPSSFTFTPLES
jgi:MauM/NapG family ferredoxin protein